MRAQDDFISHTALPARVRIMVGSAHAIREPAALLASVILFALLCPSIRKIMEDPNTNGDPVLP